MTSLAVIASRIGVQSETFIRRHMQDLYPGHTVAVARHADKPSAGYWTVSGPVLLTERQKQSRGYRIQQFVKRRLRFPPADEFMHTKTFFKAHAVSVILGEYLDVSYPYLKLAQQLGIPFYAHAHGYDVSKLLRDPIWIRRYEEFASVAGIITVSESSRERLIALGLDGQRIHVIPCGISVPDSLPKCQPATTVRCIAVGRMVGKKAPILLLDAFRRAAQSCPSLHLDYIGGGELLPAAQQFVRAFGLEERVTLHGAKPSAFVQAQMAQADIFVQHSIVDPDTGDEEGLPVSLLEAMGLGLPVVSTRHAGIPEAVVEGLTGYLVDEGDSVGMGERLSFLGLDAGLRHQLGCAGWARAKERYTWERERQDLLQVMGLEVS